MSGPAALRGGVGAALAAAALFGVGTPIAKRLLPGAGPLPLAALLYLGAGLGLAAAELVRGGERGSRREAALRRADVPLLAGIVLCGGAAAPVLLLLGLQRLAGVEASLLLNLEAPLTILLAVVLFGEHLGGRALAASAFILVGAVILGIVPAALGARGLGAALVAGACLGWAVDNNLTQRLSLRDPVAVARVKSLAAGTADLALAVVAGQAWPVPSRGVAALALGSLSYGLSIVLAVRAMRALGAARQAALFAVAPFAGALASVPVLGERIGLREIAAGAAMAAGVALLARERHVHAHVHEPLEHDHVHVHDVHHDHEHPASVAPGEPHAHPHRHARLIHTHPHVSDAHHRHPH